MPSSSRCSASGSRVALRGWTEPRAPDAGPCATGREEGLDGRACSALTSRGRRDTVVSSPQDTRALSPKGRTSRRPGDRRARSSRAERGTSPRGNLGACFLLAICYDLGMGQPDLSHIHESLRSLAVPLESVALDPRNARRHPDRNIEAIKSSLAAFGQRKPIVVQASNRVIRAGNGTYAVAKELGWSHIAAVIVEETDASAMAFAVADNRSAELATWDEPTLIGILDEIKLDETLDIELTGFSEIELDDLRPHEPGATDPDDVSEPPEIPKTKTGDLYILGPHRLLCGDSTIKADVERVLSGDRAPCMSTDPPYGVSVGAKNRLLQTFQKAGRSEANIQDDDLTPEQLEQRLLPAFILARELAMADDCTAFMTAPQGGELGMMMMKMMQKAGLKIRHVLIWMKNSPTFLLGRLDYDYQHEPILMTWGKRHKRPMQGDHRTSVWQVDKPRKSADHPTMKPVALYVNGYLNNSDRGDVVYEPYAGSGTAFVAAQETGRVCRGIEISPFFCDVIVKRWETFTGLKSRLTPP